MDAADSIQAAIDQTNGLQYQTEPRVPLQLLMTFQHDCA